METQEIFILSDLPAPNYMLNLIAIRLLIPIDREVGSIYTRCEDTNQDRRGPIQAQVADGEAFH
jgi:hypothetical protein